MPGSSTVTGALREQGFMEPASASAVLERLGSPWHSTCLLLAGGRRVVLAKPGAP